MTWQMQAGSAVLAAAGAAWLAFVALHRLLSGRHWAWLVADLVPPVAYVAVPFLLLAAAVPTGAADGWSALPPATALVLGAGHSGVGAPVRRSRRGTAALGARERREVHLVSWNTQYWHQGLDSEEFYRFLRSRRADVYTLQEYVNGPHERLAEVCDLPRLRAEFPGYHIAVAGELITLSRFPIVATPRIGPARHLGEHAPWQAVLDTAKVLRTDLRVGDGVLSVYNVHIPAQLAHGDRLHTRAFRADLRLRHAARVAQLRGLEADVDANRNPVAVLGDFNSTAAMGEMRGLLRRLAPANRAMRRLYPASWPAHRFALWQIDWALTAGVDVRSYRFLAPGRRSDHRLQDLRISAPGSAADTPEERGTP